MSKASLVDQDIICLSQEPWEGPWRTCQQIMSRLARDNRVLYVGPPLSLRQAIEALRSGTWKRPALDSVMDGLYVYREPQHFARVSATRWISRPVNWMTGRLRLGHVRRVARRLGFHAPILWLFDPALVHALGTFQERLLIYHVLDNYAEYFPVDFIAERVRVQRDEERVLRRSDVVFTVSESLCTRCRRHNPSTFLVPNGVDAEAFARAVRSEYVPPDIRSIPRPIIGYVGTLHWLIDFSLLHMISAQRPAWSLVLVGPAELGAERVQFQALLDRPNVYYLGYKPPGEVPYYIKSCDVCIVPYDPRRFTVPDSDAIKVYEYLAAGRPVVSCDIPSARRFAPLVALAHNAAEFLKLVEEGLRENPQAGTERMAVAGEHSWQRRIEAMSLHIHRALIGRRRVDGAWPGQPSAEGEAP